ncbi:DUF2149 domain-containing protein [Singulisphaera sp. GP187]|uniref:DUF2149 domain-containing protein n=1 Tax=Singulisphaera sp. GP187 TaxID=1882752 RepID=UPI001C1F781B|nr:DUF2149 domain-containing protein [Singulisphaera sp. GP187]
MQFEGDDDDPLSGVANLFDLAMVVGAALMIALVVRPQVADLLSDQDMTLVKNPGQSDMEIIVKKGHEIARYQGTANQGEGRGKRVGAAYQLEDGQIIYVPEAAPPSH